MKAKTMFKKVGFDLIASTYQGKSKKPKELLYQQQDGEIFGEIEFINYDIRAIHIKNIEMISVQLLKAINKQVEELGWNK